MEKDNIITTGQQETQLFQEACLIIEQAQESAYRQINETLIKRNWLLGLRIQHEVLKDKRAEYGEQVVKVLAKELTAKYGRGFSMRNLYNFISFYQNHPNIFHAVSGISDNILQSLTAKSDNIVNALRAQSPIRLSWTRYSIILQESNRSASRD